MVLGLGDHRKNVKNQKEKKKKWEKSIIIMGWRKREREERVKMPICTKKVNATTTEAMRRNGSDN